MKLLTKNTDYAIRALMYLGQNNNGFISSREIAEANKIPLRFTRRLLLDLKKHKIVASKEGATGGVKLGKKPKQIKLIDVLEIFQGPLSITACMFRQKLCHNRPSCVLRHQIMRIEDVIVKEFAGLTLQSLLEDIKSHKVTKTQCHKTTV